MNVKNFTTSFLLIFALSAAAQPSLKQNLNAPRADDDIIKQQVEYKDPGRSGENVLWDFGQLQSINDEYDLLYSTPNDTIITGTEHLTQYHYVLQNDSLLLWGFDNQTTQLWNIQPEFILKFPFHYGDSIGSYYYAHGKYSNRLEMDVMGTTCTTADAYGMMVLPNRDTLKQVMRTHTLKYIAENMVPITDSYYKKLESPLIISPDSINLRLATDSVVFVEEIFRWYEEGYRYPIFETVRSWTQQKGNEDYTFLNTAFFYPPQEHYYLATDPENEAIVYSKNANKKNNVLENTSFNAFPNPMTSIVNVEIFIPMEAKIKIQLRSVSNHNVYINENKGKFAAGLYTFPFSVSQLPMGYYLLNLWADNYMFSAMLLKK